MSLRKLHSELICISAFYHGPCWESLVIVDSSVCFAQVVPKRVIREAANLESAKSLWRLAKTIFKVSKFVVCRVPKNISHADSEFLQTGLGPMWLEDDIESSENPRVFCWYGRVHCRLTILHL